MSSISANQTITVTSEGSVAYTYLKYEDDTLPERILDEPVSGGPSEGFTARLAPMLEEYYAFRGWDKNGIPTQEKLKELSLEFTIEESHD